MAKINKIKKGLKIRLKGEAEKIFIKTDLAEKYAVKPTDFYGIMPKLTIKEEDEVRAGSTLFFDKKNPDVKFTSPVSGKVTNINRGERRKILEIIIEADKEIKYEKFKEGDPLSLSRTEIVDNLCKSGLWPALRQRPYDIIANPDDIPKAIFVSCFDTAPLAPDYDFVVKDFAVEFQTGINALYKLTDGIIHLNVNTQYPPSNVFMKAKNVRINAFRGIHPAGNVGVQIHKIDPINKGDIVWYISPQDIISIGRLFQKGVYDASKTVALTGSEVINTRYYKIVGGAYVGSVTKDNLKEGDKRIISGNVLTGDKINPNGYIGYYHSQVTVIPEGKYFEFLGWGTPGFRKYSVSGSFLSGFLPAKAYRLDTNLHGGLRPYVVTGQYEKVFPMDLYPVQLIKSIMIEDIDLMEKLGIYEVAPEDFALCEFVCTSKINVQEIIRKGLDIMIKEMS